MKKKIDDANGVAEFLNFNGDQVQLTFEGDNTAQMDANQAMRNDGSNGFGDSRELRKIIELDYASVRMIETMYGVHFGSQEFDDLVLSLAQSGDWNKIKTADGNLPTSMVKPTWQ